MAKDVDRSMYKYTATVLTQRREVLYVLRALSMAAQRSINNKIPWSGMTDEVWESRRGLVTVRFSESEYREQFREWARELLPDHVWTWIGHSDGDAE